MTVYEWNVGRVEFFPGAMRHLLQERDGEVGRYLYKCGVKLRTLAQASAPVKTGALRASLYLRYDEGTSNPSIIVGSELNYAYYVHEGTLPHVIRSHTPGRLLRFQVNGRMVYVTKVLHPGQKPNRFLSRHLRSAIK